MVFLSTVDHLGFIRQFARSPIRTGAVLPSSSRLSRMMISQADLHTSDTVLELGPGNGCVTENILEFLPEKARFLALEINPAFAAATRSRCPGVDVAVGDAADARRHLEERGLDGTDVVISGLPWASFNSGLQDRLLAAVSDVLRPGGRFTTFAYIQGMFLPPARRFEKRLRAEFPMVRKTKVVWRNLPPAFAYVATKAPAAT
jgi:phosphatidylethanolamine/phosphatidyl-N-methylethanolamine N-methyltransferase